MTTGPAIRKTTGPDLAARTTDRNLDHVARGYPDDRRLLSAEPALPTRAALTTTRAIRDYP